LSPFKGFLYYCSQTGTGFFFPGDGVLFRFLPLIAVLHFSSKELVLLYDRRCAGLASV